MPATVVREATYAAPAQANDAPGRLRVRIIDAGVGSSGVYPAKTLEAAAAAKVFAAGTHCFVDHPTATETFERPERSVRDLAGRLVTDAVYENGGLYADVEVFSPYRTAITEMADTIGMSIRAAALAEDGEHNGQPALIITELLEAYSVDFVTKAGRGGAIVHVLESVRAANRAVARGVEEATANELRDLLSNAVRDAHGHAESDPRVWTWLRDFDASRVWFEAESSGTAKSRIFEQHYTLDGATVTLTDAPVEVRVETRYVPVNPAGQSTTHTLESKEDTMPKIEIDEARLAALEADAGRVSTLEHERDTALAKAAALEAVARNRPIVAAVLAESTTIPAPVQGPVVEAVLTALPADADETAVKAAAEAARTAKETEVATILEAAGHGTVRGLGAPTHTPVAEAAETELDTILARTFGRTPKEA